MMNAFFPQRWTRIFVIPLVFCGLVADGNPLGEAIRVGEVQFERTDGGLRILQSSDKAIIDWESFSIGANEFTEFFQPSERSAALNRVRGATASQIDGALRANGNVILINPNGIVIGPSGMIDVGGFIASTLDISDAEFLANGDLNFRGPSQKGIVNLGSISATGGDVFLIAATVENSGTISAPNGAVGLAAGNDVLLKEAGSGPERIFVRGASGGKKATGVVNKGTINANIAELKAHGGNIYALAVNNEGRVAATGVSHEGGQIFLRAGGGGARVRNSGTLKATRQNGDGGRIELDAGPGGEIENEGTVDVSSDSGKGGEIFILGSQIHLEPGSLVIADGVIGGGDIFIGGGQRGQDRDLMNAENVTVSEGATISANGTGANAAGGNVIVFAENRLDFSGQISAAGGANGVGGFIELSGKNEVIIPDLSSRVNLGGNGTLLFDPNDIIVQQGTAGDTVTTSPANGSASANVLFDGDIANFLTNNGSLIIETTGAGGSGDITLDGNVNITWASGNDLHFNADRDFLMLGGAVIDAQGAGGVGVGAAGAITLNISSSINTAAGEIGLKGAQISISGAALSSTTGNINLATDSILLGAGTTIQSSGDLGIAPLNPGTDINLGDGTVDAGLHLDNAEIATFMDGFNSIMIGAAGITSTETFDEPGLPSFLEIGFGSATASGGVLNIGAYSVVRTVATNFTSDFIAEIDWQRLNSGSISFGLGTAPGTTPDARGFVGYPAASYGIQDNGVTAGFSAGGAGNSGTLRLSFNSAAQELTYEIIKPDTSVLSLAPIDISDNGFDNTNSRLYVNAHVHEFRVDNFSITQAPTGAVNIGGGVFQDNLTIHGGSINMTGLDAGINTVDLIAHTGAISDAADAAIDVTAVSVNFLAPGNIGASGNAISVSNGATITANSSGGGIFLDGAGDLSVGMVGSTTGLTTKGGAIEVATPTGRLDMQEAIQSNGGDIDLSGVGIDLTTTTADVINTGAGSVALTATQNVMMVAGSSISTADGDISIGANAGGVAGDFNGIEIRGSVTSSNGAITFNGIAGNSMGNTGVWIADGTGIEGQGLVKITGASQDADESGVVIDAPVFSNGDAVEIITGNGPIKIGSSVVGNLGVKLIGSASDDTEFLITSGLQLENLTVGGGAGGTVNTLDFSGFNEGPVELGADQLSNIKFLDGSTDSEDIFLGGKSSAATFTITGADELTYDDGAVESIDLTGFEHLTGGDLDDMFVIQDNSGFLSGNIDGGAHTTNDTLDYASVASTFGPVAVDLENRKATGIGGNFSNIEDFIGSADPGDSFTGPASGQIEINGADEFEVTGVFTAKGFENLIGGTGSNTFTLNPGGSISGMLEGNGGPNETLSFADFGSAVSVDLEAATATGIGQMFTGINNFEGSSETTDQITLFDTPDQIEVDEDDSGVVNGNVFFNSFESVNTGDGNDQINFNGLFTFTNSINGGSGFDGLDIDTEGVPTTIGTPNVAVISGGQISINPVWNFTGFENIAIQMGGGNDSVFTQPTSFSQNLDGGAGTDSLYFPVAPFGSGSPVLGVSFNSFELLFFAPNTVTGDVLTPVPDPPNPFIPPANLTDIGGLFQANIPDPGGPGDGGGSAITFTEITGGAGAEVLQNVLGAFSAIAQQAVLVVGVDANGGIAVAPLSLDGSGIQPSNLGIQILQQALSPDANTELLGALGLDIGITLLSEDGGFALDLSGPPLAVTVQALLIQLSPNAQADLQNALEIAIVISLTPVDGSIALDSTNAQPAQATLLIFNDQLGQAALNELNASLGIQ